KAEIYIGDLINYKITITYDSTYQLVPPPLGANLGAFDVKDYKPDIITRLPDGRIKSENIFILSTFTTGDYIIPPIPIVFILPDSSRKALLSESVPIKVKSLLIGANDSTDVKPLKPQYEFKRNLTPYYIWGGVILLLLIVIAVFIWLKVKRKKEPKEPVDLRPAWEIAFEKLVLLKQKELLSKEEYKLYYIELTEILRAYLEKMLEINVLDMTTEEFLATIKENHLPHDFYERVESFLNHADLVKFAKYIPELKRAQDDFDEVHNMIELLRADYEQRMHPKINIHNHTNIDIDNDTSKETVSP
ncbi:MAG: hypothetical protein GXO93_06770, partial [FCB group bacterium]|nr:hypothetical protein [FCB group bacterium]